MRVKEKDYSLMELLVVIAIVATLCSGTAKAADAVKPNVVFIFADDPHSALFSCPFPVFYWC